MISNLTENLQDYYKELYNLHPDTSLVNILPCLLYPSFSLSSVNIRSAQPYREFLWVKLMTDGVEQDLKYSWE